MTDLVAKCENCIHYDICKHIDEYTEAVQILENEASVFDDLVNINVKCKYFYFTKTQIQRSV